MKRIFKMIIRKLKRIITILGLNLFAAIALLAIGSMLVGLTGFYLTKGVPFVYCVLFGIIVLPIIGVIYLIKNKKARKEVGVTILITIYVFYILSLTALVAIFLSKYTNIDKASWLNFLGTIIGSGITVFGAYIVTVKQIKDNNKKYDFDKNEQYKSILQLIAFLLENEVDYNKGIYDEKYEKLLGDQGTVIINEEFKFACEEWTLIKHDAIKLINNGEMRNAIINIVKLYSKFEKINNEIERGRNLNRGYKMHGNECSIVVTELKFLFEDAMNSLCDIENILSNGGSSS